MKNYLNNHLLIAANALVLAVIIALSAWTIENTKAKTLSLLQTNIDSQVALISELAELTDRNGADAVTEKIISDCPRRVEFENQLMRLDTATKRELISIQQLFESCGAFFSERKALMVSRLEREFKGLKNNLALLNTIRDLTPKEEKLKEWEKLIELEKTRSSLLSEQTEIQEKIISLLMSDTSVTSQINVLVQDAQDVAQSLSVIGTQIDTLTTELIN